MSSSDESLLTANGWTLECTSPFEVRHDESGSFASGLAADAVLAQLRESEEAPATPLAQSDTQSAELLSELCQLADRTNQLVELAPTSPSADPWQQVYGLVFSDALIGRVRTLCAALGIQFSYYDPDSGYEEDVRAFAQALTALKADLEHLMPAFR